MTYRDEKETLRRRVQQLEADLERLGEGDAGLADALRHELTEARDEAARLKEKLRKSETRVSEHAATIADLEEQLNDTEEDRGKFSWLAPAGPSAPYWLFALALLGAFVWGIVRFDPGSPVSFIGGGALATLFFGLYQQGVRERRRTLRGRQAMADAARPFSTRERKKKQRRRVRVDTRRQEVEVRAHQAARKARRR